MDSTDYDDGNDDNAQGIIHVNSSVEKLVCQ